MLFKLTLHSKLLLMVSLGLAVLALAACIVNVTAPPTDQPDVSPLSTLSMQVGNVTPTFLTTPVVTNTIVSLNATLTNTFDLQLLEIESDEQRFVAKAFWSDDDSTIYYAFSLGSGESRPLEWAAYNTMTHTTTVISPLLTDLPAVWKALNVPEPDPGLHIELQGYVSPSGRHVIYVVPIKSTPPKLGVWLADTHTLARSKLMEVPNHGDVLDALWYEDETKIIFRYGEETSGLYIVDIRNGRGRQLNEVTDFDDELGESWDASPDGKTLAVTDFQGARLWLVSLEDGRAKLIDKPVAYVHWSRDGKTLYYSTDTREFRSYNIGSGKISTLITNSQVKDIYSFGDFAVSPNGDKVLFWGGWLRLIDLHR